MKKLLLVAVLFILVGGGVAALWYLHVPPFGNAAQKGKEPARTLARRPGPEAPVLPQTGAGAESIGTPARPTAEDEQSATASEPAPASSPATQQSSRSPRPSSKTAVPVSVSEPDIARLAGVYEQMPVDEATKILSRLPDAVVEPLLRRMDEKQVGKLLSAFRPERAAKLTLAMAQSGPAPVSGAASP